MSACAFAQTSSSTQPWAATSQWSVAATQGALLGPMVVDSSGDLLVANTLVGFSAPTKILGGATRLSWVSKVNASGTPVFGVQIGGVNVINPIAADSSGNILITGGAAASGLPVTPNAYIQSSSGDGSAFACKLSGTDGTPVFCTYLNSNQLSTAGIGSDAQGNIYILAGGPTNAIVTTPEALSLGNQNVVLLKLDPTGQKLLYAAAFGGSGAETPTGLTVDADGNTYVIGITSSMDFPGTASGAISTPSDAFLAKVDPTGSKILYASYGRAFDHPFALAVDLTGAAYVAGTVGTANLYMRKYSAGGTTMDYENVLAGTARSSVSGAAVDSAGVLTLVGDANGLDFPEQLPTAPCLALSEPYPASDAGGYMIRLAADGSVLQSTFLSAVQPSFRAYSGSVVSTQPGHGWLVQTTRDFTSVGVVQVGPLATPLSSVSIVCITDAASFTPGGIAPGEMISIFGTGLGPAAPQTFTLDSNGRIASTLAGVQVTFDGAPAPLLFVEDGQVNAITPWELAGKSTTEMCVVYNGNKECVTPSVGCGARGVHFGAG